MVRQFPFKRMANATLEDEVEGTSWKLWIPESLTAGPIQRAHTEETAAHGGMENLLHALRRQFYWPGIYIDFRRKVSPIQTWARLDLHIRRALLKVHFPKGDKRLFRC
ncbi:hypothetical protein ACLKA6_001863 [Drosophila palustris]